MKKSNILCALLAGSFVLSMPAMDDFDSSLPSGDESGLRYQSDDRYIQDLDAERYHALGEWMLSSFEPRSDGIDHVAIGRIALSLPESSLTSRVLIAGAILVLYAAPGLLSNYLNQ